MIELSFEISNDNISAHTFLRISLSDCPTINSIVYLVVAVIFIRWADIQPLNPMVGSCGFSLCLGLVCDDFCAKGCEGSLIQVKVAKYLVLGRQFGIQAGRSEHIQGCNCLGNEATARVGRKVLTGAIVDGDLEVANSKAKSEGFQI